MKTTLNLIIGLALLISCQIQKETLELNLEKGETYSQRFTHKFLINQTITDQQVNTAMFIDSKITYKIIDIQNGVYDMEVRYEELKMEMIFPHGEMEFSSKKNNADDIFSTLLGAIINKPFFVKMTKTGKVNEVKGIESLFAGMFDQFPQISNIQKQQIEDQLMQAYGENAVKGNIEACFAIFPDLPVSKGEKWTVNTQLESGMSGNVETIYQLADISDSYYHISGNSKIKTADKNSYIKTNGMPVKYDMTGTMTSYIKIDKKTGWVLSAKINQSISGTAQIKDDTHTSGEMTIPMTINGEMIISEK